MWSMYRLLVLSLFVTSFATASDSAGSPWTDQWSMTLKGEERWYVEHEGTNYLEVISSDLEDLVFLIDKDIMVQTKFRQLEGVSVQFYSFPTLIIGADSESWSTIIDGDNVFILGKATATENGKLVFKTKKILRAPSDSHIIAKKLAEIAETDYDARVKFSQWVRQTGKTMGNRTVWITAADNIVDDAINAVAKEAEAKRNVYSLLKVMSWCSEELSDSSRAAALGSQDWVNELSEEKTNAITERMSVLGLTKFEGRWMTKRDQKIKDFHQQLRALKQDNVQGFLALANDIAQYRDVLPEAIELQHMALKKGLDFNPNSNQLREALGKKTVEQEIESLGLKADFADAPTGLLISNPERWKRSKDSIDGDVTWIDPASETAYISLTILRGAESNNFAALFDKQMENYKAKPGYTENNAEALGIGSASREARFSFLEGREQREGILSCTLYMSADSAFAIYASYVSSEAVKVDAAYKHILTALESVNAKTNTPASDKATNSAEGVPKVAAPSQQKAPKKEAVQKAPAPDVDPDAEL